MGLNVNGKTVKLRQRAIHIVFATFLVAQTGCMGKSVVTPADRANKQTWYTDCCNPGLSAGDKELCGYAAKDEDHIRWDTDGNRYVYVWSDCEVGKEPWRKYDSD